MNCLCGRDFEPRQGKGGRPQRYCSERCANRARQQRNRDRANITVASGPIAPILKYPGAKWRLASWIVSYFPKHLHYLEPYAGSAACFFSKEPSVHEVLGDTNHQLINLFTVIRDSGEELARRIALTGWCEEEYALCEKRAGLTGDPIEDARRFLVYCWQAHGTQLGKSSCGWRHNGLNGHAYPTRLWQKLPERILAVVSRLKQAEIRNRPALEMVDYYNAPDCLIYADPPYILSTRLSEGHYDHEMTNDDHRALLEALDRHSGPVILSGYAHPIYDERLSHWQRVEVPAVAEHGRRRVEVLWLNPKAAKATAHQQGQLWTGTEAV